MKKNKSLYLSVNVFSTAVLIEDTVNSEKNIINQRGDSFIDHYLYHGERS